MIYNSIYSNMILNNKINEVNTDLNTLWNGGATPVYFTGEYVEMVEGYASATCSLINVDLIFNVTKSIPTGANTVICKGTGNDKPRQKKNFILVTPSGKSFLSFVDTDFNITICNYSGIAISVGEKLYAIGFAYLQ